VLLRRPLLSYNRFRISDGEPMALDACRECGNQISTKAKTCPHCGIKSPTRTKSSVIGAVVILGIISFVVISKIQGDKEEAAEQECLKEHPLSPVQATARHHFGTCYQYRHMPSSVWSDDRRALMLLSEGCYSDDRDDPRYDDAAWDYCKAKP
jgi:RNA polymerase subunit RPABC4/transcription elongation factor Spt4